MVVMDRGAPDVGVLAGRQVEALDDPELGQDLEGAEDRRAADPEAAVPGLTHQVGRGEMPGPVRDELCQRPARCGQSITGAIERHQQRSDVSHAATVPRLGVCRD